MNALASRLHKARWYVRVNLADAWASVRPRNRGERICMVAVVVAINAGVVIAAVCVATGGAK